MFWLIGAFIIFLILFFIFFVSRRFSPIPYFPSNHRDFFHINKALRIRANQVIYDLGAGDGSVIFAAAYEAYKKRLNTLFIAVEINPILIGYMMFKRLIHPNRQHIRILHGDIFTLHYPAHLSRTSPTFYTYISPWYLKRVFQNIKLQHNRFELVSYFYPLPSILRMKPHQTLKGVHSIYSYTVK